MQIIIRYKSVYLVLLFFVALQFSTLAQSSNLFSTDGSTPFRITSSLTPEHLPASWQDIQINDRLFDGLEKHQDVASVMGRRNHKALRASNSSFRDIPVSDMDLSKVAFTNLLRQAKLLGIPERKISQAILEGRLTPRLDDLHQAFRGIKSFTPAELLTDKRCCRTVMRAIQTNVVSHNNHPAIKKLLLKEGVLIKKEEAEQLGLEDEDLWPITDTSYVISYSRMTQEIVDILLSEHAFGANLLILNDYYRHGWWVERCGGLQDIDTLNTFRNGKSVVLSREELDVITAKWLPQPGAHRSDSSRYWAKNPSVYNYLFLGQLPYGYSKGEDSPERRHLDYEMLRRTRYVPMLQRMAFSQLVASKPKVYIASEDPKVISAIKVVQRSIRESGTYEGLLSDDGVWGKGEELGVHAIILALQDIPDLKWSGAKDGLFTDAFRVHFESWLNNVEGLESDISNLFEFRDAIVLLKSVGIYNVSQSSELLNRSWGISTVSPQEVSGNTDLTAKEVLAGAALLFANGFACEWGDELIYLFIREEENGGSRVKRLEARVPYLLDRMMDEYTVLSYTVSIVGCMVSPFGIIAILYCSMASDITSFKAFRIGFMTEVCEALFSLWGEWSTFHEALSISGRFIIGVIAAGCLTGKLASGAADRKVFLNSAMKSEIALLICGVFAVYLMFVKGGMLQ